MEKPILFSTPMVQAILEDRKSMTRRVVKPQPTNVPNNTYIARMPMPWLGYDVFYLATLEEGQIKKYWQDKCPYGQPGDTVWIKETFYQYGEWFDTPQTDEYGEVISKRTFIPQNKDIYPIYYADTLPADIKVLKGYKSGRGYYKRPSIFMPREAARLFLTVKSIRIERLQDITEEDAKAEGFYKGYQSTETSTPAGTAKQAFMWIWQKINGNESWLSNPWVWIVEFEKQQGGMSE